MNSSEPEIQPANLQARLTKLVFSDSPMIVVLFDKDQKIEFANQTLYEMLGTTSEAVIGKQLNEILGDRAFATSGPNIESVLRGEKRLFENTVVRKDGTEINVLVHMVPDFDDQQTVVGGCSMVLDTSELKEAKNEIRRKELRIRTAVEGSSVGIVEFCIDDPDWVFSEHVESLLGFKKGELKNSRQLIRSLIHPDDLEINDRAKRVEANDRNTNIEIRLKNKQGAYRWYAINSRFILSPDDKTRRRIGTISDIDNLKTAQLNAANEIKRRDDYLAMLSHELRNPMTAITFSLDCLKKETQASDNANRFVDIISRQTAHMSKLLQDLLDVSRVTQNRIDFNFVAHDLNQSVDDIVNSIMPAITEKKQSLNIQLHSEPLIVQGDVVRLKQAMANLLENASKYSPDSAALWLQTRRVDGMVRFSVRDSGIGIDKQSLADIFKLFFQKPQPLDRKSGGMGVGLYLVDQIVRAHGGQIDVQSQLGQGSEFTFSIPASDQAEIGTTPDIASQSFHGRQAIVVEDNTDSRKSLAQLLRQSGFRVTEFADGEAAAKQISSLEFDVAIIDIGLPLKNGLELATEIRHWSHLGNSVLIAMTGYGQASDKDLILSAGFDQHVVKPVNFQELRVTLSRALEERAV